MRLPHLFLSAAFALCATTPALSQDATKIDGEDSLYLPNTGSELLDLIQDCDSDQCMSYISGAIGGISVYAILAEKPSPFCAGDSVETVQIRDAIVETISSTPALKENHPAIGILAAFGRNWPCMTDEDLRNFQNINAIEVAPDTLSAINTSNSHMLRYGPEDAPANRQMSVFYDPNCEACRRFQAETRALAEDGWRITVYPAANTNEDSAGYGAVALALRDLDPTVVETLYAALPETADFETAIDLAIEAGIPANDVLKAVATTGAYTAVENNTRTLLEVGAEGTPAWIVGNSLYTGFLGASAVINVTSGGDAATNAPSPDSTAPAAQMEQ